MKYTSESHTRFKIILGIRKARGGVRSYTSKAGAFPGLFQVRHAFALPIYPPRHLLCCKCMDYTGINDSKAIIGAERLKTRYPTVRINNNVLIGVVHIMFRLRRRAQSTVLFYSTEVHILTDSLRCNSNSMECTGVYKLIEAFSWSSPHRCGVPISFLGGAKSMLNSTDVCGLHGIIFTKTL
ncbi:hypothetical protein BDQ17DRAFT_1362469 [Cyathus striatus]|nr:hypothetical protein BDQ17DRAFT_1362469 [Cyathus striatus]